MHPLDLASAIGDAHQAEELLVDALALFDIAHRRLAGVDDPRVARVRSHVEARLQVLGGVVTAGPDSGV